MEYDSSSSCEERQKDPYRANTVEDRAETETSMRTIASLSFYDGETLSRDPNFPLLSKRSLSAQVMEYYRKYSQNSTLGRYFSLPEGVAPSEVTNFHRTRQISIPETRVTRESYVLLTAEERSRLESTPRERRRWARPPLIGQPSTSDGVGTTNYGSMTANQDSRTPSPISKRPITETILEEKNESRETLVENSKDETKAASPTSSVASHKPLEWDSGADVGYYNAQPRSKDEKDKKLCTIERMALARGCSVAMRLDPEGKNESASLRTNSRGSRSMKPDANSTPLIGHISDYYESEIAITPIVKNQIIEVQQRREIFSKTGKSIDDEAEEIETHRRGEIKYPTEGSRSTRQSSASSPLKKSSSMNLLALPMARLSLKRSQSELNLRARDKKIPPFTFESTSSIATVVDKPRTCDKFIQTSLDCCSRESVGIQVEVSREEEISKEEKSKSQRIGEKIGEIALDNPEEEKPPLPKRASSLAPKVPPSILKNSKKNRDDSRSSPGGNSSEDLLVEKDLEDDETRRIRRNRGGTRMDTSSERSRRDSSSSSKLEILGVERTEDDLTGRASNSFEYFPGHVYQNVNGGNSGISSIETGRESRCSTMPNTSSSIDEKLWGDSDNLVRDLERRVNVLKSLVDGNKCDKQVKKRLIHHIIKRLVTAKYMDDRIERDLEENVPWNPADARKKIYRNEIIQALTNKNNTTDSSYEEWRPRNKRNLQRCPSPERSKEGRSIDNEIDVSSREASTENSDKFVFDRHNNDGAVMDGRKARMGLRNEDRGQEANIDGEKSESSECFLPQTRKTTNVYYSVERSNEKLRPPKICLGDSKTTNFPTTTTTTTTTTTGTSTISPTSSVNSNENQISNRIVLVKEKRRTKGDDPDWRLPTTMSERRFELGRCSNSESGEAKLINYAEMEKRNQLVWITNEISHLCNLKRLLEEPNTIEDRSRKNINGLPIGSWIVQAHVETNASNRSDQAREIATEASASSIRRDESLEKSLDNQWSSHGNLACGRSNEFMKKRDDERSGPTRKRNSCTQTGNDAGSGGHSKTGGEIVSASFPVLVSINSTRANRQMQHEMRDVSVQTQMEMQETYQNINSMSPQIMSDDAPARIEHRSSNCTNRYDSQINGNDEMCKEKPRHVCYCQRYAAHSRHRACVIHSPMRRRREHAKNCPRRSPRKVCDRPIITQPISQNIPGTSVRTMESRKEAKNQLNATCKSKYAIHELSEKGRNSCARCEEKKRQPEVATETLKTGLKNTRINDITDDCVCRDVEDDENDEKSEESERLCCETGSEHETRYRDNSSTQPKCTCNFEQNVDAEDTSGSVNERPKVANPEGKAKSCKSCRTCGTVWIVKDGKNANRRCKCSQDYLKPVAYELKFNDDFRDKEKSRDSLQKNSRDKRTRRIDLIRENGTTTYTKTRTKGTQSAPSAEKSQGHYDEDKEEEEEDGDEEKQESVNEDEQPGTLKDFLATNRPEFLENVETRRRYMSEISQLRQLKREKRKQFLALAGSASFLKPSRPVKGSTAHSQKKLSESELKLRLRMRYLRLNEVRNKRRQREKEEDARRNQLMAKLFGQKLQQKVLNGQVDLSQSVSVISNL